MAATLAIFHLMTLLCLSPLVSGSALLQNLAHAGGLLGFRFSRDDPAARTLLAIDTNHDGRLDPSEIAAFARSQGMDPAAATEEFASIDLNGDGTLDSAELSQALGTPSKTNKLSSVVPAPNTQADAALDSEDSTIQNYMTDKADKSDSATLAQSDAVTEAHGSNDNEMQIPVVATNKGHAPRASTNATDNLFATSAGAIEEATANVSSLASAREAAQQVAEQLVLEENEEREARESDLKAAEVRATSTALAKKTVEQALAAGSEAAHKKASELIALISKLEQQALRAEVKAAALHAKSKSEMDEANKMMAMANEALQKNAANEMTAMAS